MKKIAMIAAVAVLALSFASCRKERVCECIVTSDQPGSTSATVKVTVKKAKKDVCEKNSASSIQTAPTTTGSNNYTTKVDCTLK